jgi:hypothetical protein
MTAVRQNDDALVASRYQPTAFLVKLAATLGRFAMKFGRTIVLALAIMPLSLASPAMAKGEKSWDTASSVGAYGLAAVALGLPIVKKDKAGALQAAGSIAATELVTFGMERSFPRTSPGW